MSSENNSSEALTLKQHQELMLQMLIKFDEYCSKKGLRYYLAFGTLIGAIRHNGFIPWDDDVDIFMPRPDYEKLLKDSMISEDLEVVSLFNNNGHYHPFAYANICDTNTRMIEHNISKSTNKGAFLDVFPLDGIPNDKRIQKKHIRMLMRKQSVLGIIINVAPGFNNIKNTIKSILHYLLIWIDPVKLAIQIDNIAKTYDYDKYSNVIHGTLLSKTIHEYIFPKTDFEPYLLHDFCEMKLRVPTGFDSILKMEYGDYMKPPPTSEQSGHHGIEIYLLQE